MYLIALKYNCNVIDPDSDSNTDLHSFSLVMGASSGPSGPGGPWSVQFYCTEFRFIYLFVCLCVKSAEASKLEADGTGYVEDMREEIEKLIEQREQAEND